jgi:hypothetical protein
LGYNFTLKEFTINFDEGKETEIWTLLY